MRRRLVALAALAALVALAGCSTILGPGQPDPSQLGANATYDWSTNVTGAITLNESSYASVYDVSRNDTLEVYRTDSLGRDQHIEIRSLRYRFPNGTVVGPNHSALSATYTRQRTIIDVPNASGGQVAFTAARNGKSFGQPIYLHGSYEVTLPEGMRVGIPMLSRVDPGGYTTSMEDGRMVIRWDEITAGSMRLRFYLERDILLFGSIVAGGIAIGAGGIVYYYRQISRLKRRREEADIDVEEDDDPRDRGPPPGMK